MWNGFVGRLIRRTNQHWLIWGFEVLACAILFLGYHWTYLHGFFTAPRVATAEQLASASSPADFSDPFLSVKADSTEPTGIAETESAGGENAVKAAFVSAVLDGRRMLVRVAPDDVPSTTLPGGVFAGEIKRIGDLRSRIPSLALTPDFLPLYLDTYQYRGHGFLLLALAAPVLIVALWILQHWLQVVVDPGRHSLCRGLSGQGELDTLVQWIDSNMSAPHTTYIQANTIVDLGQHWLVTGGYLAGVAIQISAIVWIHRLVVKRRIFFLIPAGSRSLVSVYDQFGQHARISLSASVAQQLFDQLCSLAPNAIHGFDRRLPALWRSMKNKSAFLEAAKAMLGGASLPEERLQ